MTGIKIIDKSKFRSNAIVRLVRWQKLSLNFSSSGVDSSRADYFYSLRRLGYSFSQILSGHKIRRSQLLTALRVGAIRSHQWSRISPKRTVSLHFWIMSCVGYSPTETSKFCPQYSTAQVKNLLRVFISRHSWMVKK